MFQAASAWSYKALPSIGTWLQVSLRDYLSNFSYCIWWISNIPFNIRNKVINDFKHNQISEPIAYITGSIQGIFLRFCSLESHLVPNLLLVFSQRCKDLTTNHCERRLHNVKCCFCVWWQNLKSAEQQVRKKRSVWHGCEGLAREADWAGTQDGRWAHLAFSHKCEMEGSRGWSPSSWGESCIRSRIWRSWIVSERCCGLCVPYAALSQPGEQLVKWQQEWTATASQAAPSPPPTPLPPAQKVRWLLFYFHLNLTQHGLCSHANLELYKEVILRNSSGRSRKESHWIQKKPWPE